MGVLDWLFVGVLSAAILCLLVTLFLIVLSMGTGKKVKLLKQRKPKNKRKRKRLKREIRQLEKKKKKQLRNGILLLLTAGVLAGGAFYAQYYQATNLSDYDSENVVQAYYLMSETEGAVTQVKDGENQVKAEKTLRELAARLASYGGIRSSTRITTEGQLLLNRYYTSVKELGLNLNSQTKDTLQHQETYDGFLKDITKITEQQKKVIDYFGINESALQQKK
ncbi:hypothetical protein ACYSNR_07665 [Enterococcus sp. LJL128]